MSLASPFPLGLGGDTGCATCYTVTVAQLITRVRERADIVGSSFVSDATLIDWINEGHQKLHGMLVEAFGEEYMYDLASFTTVAGQIDFAVPCCFYKLYGVDLEINGKIRALKPFSRAERNTYRNIDGSGVVPMYSLSGGNLKLYPVQPDGLVGEIIYAPEATLLSLTTDQIKYPNGWERFIVLDAAIQVLLKEESSATALIAEREAVRQEIERAKELRDLASPKRVTDVNNIDADMEPWL